MKEVNNRPVFDREAALERVDGDLEFLKELVNIFKEDYPKKLADLSMGIREKDFKTIMETAHSIKSASGNLGLTRIYQLSFEMEKRGMEREPKGMKGNYMELLEELEKLKNLF